MPSSYPAAPDDLTAGNTGLDHGDVTDAVAAVQATLGVNPQGAAATVADRLDGPNLDLLDQGPFNPDPPAAGYVRITAAAMEGGDQPPFLVVTNSEGFDARIISEDDLDAYLLGSFLAGNPLGTIAVKGADDDLPSAFPPGTDGQVLTADSTNALGLAYTDPHILTSPDLTQWRIVVDNAGVLGTELA